MCACSVSSGVEFNSQRKRKKERTNEWKKERKKKKVASCWLFTLLFCRTSFNKRQNTVLCWDWLNTEGGWYCSLLYRLAVWATRSFVATLHYLLPSVFRRHADSSYLTFSVFSSWVAREVAIHNLFLKCKEIYTHMITKSLLVSVNRVHAEGNFQVQNKF